MKHDAAAERLLQIQTMSLFLQDEIERSSELLRRFAEIVAVEIGKLAESINLPPVESSIACMTEALQTEDRVQQRLQDIGVALCMLEQAADPASDTACENLPMSVIEQLKLDEMQIALAIKANIHHQKIQTPFASAPSVGEIDLF